ncbi:sulfotransferase domain-containing protein [Pelagerythrobacter sp.]|uniref:sulfotransferase domain-containing protein n=1 Tax=Pelagerythrobacter sp. TaxID=2800702 RepID=UPI0035B02450
MTRADGLALPNFLIVGAMKAGTSSLADLLDSHDDIFVAERELHFFNDERAFARGLASYSRHFQGTHARWQGEKTPVYSRIADMGFLPQRIYDSLGADLRLLWIFRDPVDRAVSHYRHMLITQGNPDRAKLIQRNGRLRTFAEVIAEELRDPPRSVIVSRGYYAEQVEAFRSLFPARNFFFCEFDQLRGNPQGLLDSACLFFGVAPIPVVREPSRNRTDARLRQGLFGKAIKRLRSGQIPTLTSLTNAARARSQKAEIIRRFADIDEGAKASLREHYRPHEDRLRAILDRQPQA